MFYYCHSTLFFEVRSPRALRLINRKNIEYRSRNNEEENNNGSPMGKVKK